MKDTSYVDSDIKEGKTYSYAIEGYTAKDDKTYVGKKVEIEVKNTQETTTKPTTTTKPSTHAKSLQQQLSQQLNQQQQSQQQRRLHLRKQDF